MATTDTVEIQRELLESDNEPFEDGHLIGYAASAAAAELVANWRTAKGADRLTHGIKMGDVGHVIDALKAWALHPSFDDVDKEK